MSEDDISFYPPAPKGGSSAFGEFSFGISPFGTVPPFDWRETVISQYANSPVILQLIQSWFSCMDPAQAFDSFFDNIWNVYTATGYGLDIWGLIVGVSRTVQLENPGNYFGFEQGAIWDNFGPGGVSPFYTGQPITSNYSFTDVAYRQLILAKALANICDGAIPALNAILLTLFGPANPFGTGGNCYVTNGLDMSMTFTFDFDLNPVQQAIIQQSNVLPIPGGVVVTIIVP